jgi:hypothetical protein
MSLTIPNASNFEMTHRLSCEVPKIYVPGCLILIERIVQRHNGFGKLVLDVPFKPRSSGPKKQGPDDLGYQSNHLHGHLSQLAEWFGMTMSEIKLAMKYDVPDWPMQTKRLGKSVIVFPDSEARVSMAVESRAIEWTHKIAAEEGITLKEE